MSKNTLRGVYIHIPFCHKMCSYCDFAKFYYKEEYADKYLEALKKEMNNYQGDLVNTIYIGGGTPSALSLEQLHTLLEMTKRFKLDKNYEFTIEVNPESIDEEKLTLFKKYGVNRLSIGVESFHPYLIKELNRTRTDIVLTIQLCQKYISNINVDLMYALPSEDMEMLHDDVKQILSLNVPHISNYSLILEEHTKMYVDGMRGVDEDSDALMYHYIEKALTDVGYEHYETSNYAKKNYYSRHNLKYWNNTEYYGFGIGASGYIDNRRYSNTRSYNDYIAGKYVYEEHQLTKKEDMQNYMILGLRKREGVSEQEFLKRYQISIDEAFDIETLLANGSLISGKDRLYINPKYTYTANEILIYFI